MSDKFEYGKTYEFVHPTAHYSITFSLLGMHNGRVKICFLHYDTGDVVFCQELDYLSAKELQSNLSFACQKIRESDNGWRFGVKGEHSD